MEENSYVRFNKEQAGLSWGAIHAKTVRLQRQIEEGLIDIHFKVKNKGKF